MAEVYIYLKLDPYLAQWFVNEMGGEPVRLPKRSAESDILEFFLKPTPEGILPERKKEGDISIVLPAFKHKDPAHFNYLPPRAMKALARCISTRFKVQLWQDLHQLHHTESCITDLIYAWMENHGIELTAQNWETLRQMYFRKRKVYLREKNVKKKHDINEEK